MAEDVFGIVGTTQAGAYRVEQVVAEGGFAVVYRAHHEAFRAKVALKCLKVPESLAQQHREEFLERFREEGELLFRLSTGTPAVVRPLHVGVLDTPSRRFVPFIALEWLDGETLDAVIARRTRAGEPPIGLHHALQLLSPVARALERAHHFPGPTGEICILHRDLKPENIFLAEAYGQRSAKILDFGIGKVKSVATQMVGHQSADSGGMIAFTPAFGAPEQWLPKRFGQTGPWTDVWGLALTLLSTLIGRPPFEGDQAALLGSAIDPGRRPTPRTEGVHVPDSVERVFAKAVAVDPRDRYTDVGVFWTEIHKAAEMREGTISISPPAPYAPQKLLVSLKPDPMAATTPIAAQAIPSAQAASPDLEVPDLELGTPARPKSNPRAVPAPKREAARITLMRDADAAPGNVPASAIGGSMLDDDLDSGPVRQPSRAAVMNIDLDSVGISPRSHPVRPAAARHYQQVDSEPDGATVLKEQLKLPLKLIVAGMLVGIAGVAYTEFVGEPLAVGPVQPLHIAGPLVILGVLIALVRFFQQAK